MRAIFLFLAVLVGGCATKSNRRLRHTRQDATGAVPVRGGTFWNRIGPRLERNDPWLACS